jgi:hypothetical protein
MDASEVSTYAGLRRELEVGLRIAPTRASAIPAAKAVASYLDADPRVAVRLVGLSRDDSRVLITVAVNLGTIDEIKSAHATSRAALALIQTLVDHLAAYDPAFVTLPHPASPEASLATQVAARQARGESDVATAVRVLSTVA